VLNRATFTPTLFVPPMPLARKVTAKVPFSWMKLRLFSLSKYDVTDADWPAPLPLTRSACLPGVSGDRSVVSEVIVPPPETESHQSASPPPGNELATTI